MKLFISIVICLLQLNALSQTTIKRVVVNDERHPLIGTVVTCLDKNDKLLHGSITDVTGTFSITADFSQKEWLRVSYLGYENQDFNSLASLPDTIVMKERSEELGEVVVQGKSIVTQKSDRLVFNIANSNLTKGNNTMQLLRFTPLMRMDNDKISMLGKSKMQLYINGKKSNMGDDALQNYLRTLPAEKVERIELLTNPGGEFRVESDEGILNVVLKKNENEGWKGVLALNDKLGYYNSYGGNLYLDYQKDKFSLSMSGYGNRNQENIKENTRYEYLNENLSNTVNQITRLDHRLGGANLNMDYQLAKNHNIGMMVDAFYARRYDNIDSNTDYSSLHSNVADSSIYTMNRGDREQLMLTGNLNYRWKTDKKGSKLSFDVDYLWADNNLEQPMTYTYTIQSSEKRFTQNTDEIYNTYSAKLEYLHVFKPQSRLRVGLESYHTNNDRNFFYGNYQNGRYESDVQKSNRFEIDENYWAAYATLDKVWKPEFIMTLGVRSEYLERKGTLHNNSENVYKDDFSILPNATFMYTPNDNHQLVYALSSRMAYPSFKNLNPFRYYISSTVFRENDPTLGHSRIFTQSLTYILKRHYTFTINHMTGKGINTFSTPVEGGLTRISARSFGRIHIIQGVFNWNNSFWDNRLYLNASLDGMFNRSYGHFDEYKIDVSDFSYSASLDLGLLLSKRYKWSMEFSGKYQSEMELAQEASDDSYHLNLGVRKNFKNGISLRVNGDYLIHNEGRMKFLNTDNYEFYKNANYHFRKLSATVSVPFGKKKVKGSRKNNGISLDVKKRIKE